MIAGALHGSWFLVSLILAILGFYLAGKAEPESDKAKSMKTMGIVGAVGIIIQLVLVIIYMGTYPGEGNWSNHILGRVFFTAAGDLR